MQRDTCKFTYNEKESVGVAYGQNSVSHVNNGNLD